MGFITQNVIGKGVNVKFQFINDGNNKPEEYTITLTASANAHDSSIRIVSSDRVSLQHNTILKFRKIGPYFNVNAANKYDKKIEISNNGVLPQQPPKIGDTILINGFLIHRVVSVETTSTTNLIGVNPSIRFPLSVGTEIEILTDVVIDLPNVSDLNDTIIIPSTGSIEVPVLKLSSPLQVGVTATTYALLELLGINDASPIEAPQSVDATDHRSALSGNQKSIATILSKTLNLSGFKIKNDRAQSQVLMRSLNDGEYQNLRLWLEVYSSDGDFRSGIANITDSGLTDSAAQLTQFNRTITFIDDFTWISGDNLLYIPPLDFSNLPNLPITVQSKFSEVARLVNPENPAAIANLLKDGYWWDGSNNAAVGDQISSVPSWTQTRSLIAVGANRPTQRTNGISFDGIANYLDGGSLPLIPATDEFAITFVLAPNNPYTDRRILFSQYQHPGEGLLWGFNIGDNVGVAPDINVNMQVDEMSTSILTIHRKGNEFIQRSNGLEIMQTGAFNLLQTGFLIGARGNGTLAYNSTLVEHFIGTIKGVIVTLTNNINVKMQEDFARYFYG